MFKQAHLDKKCLQDITGIFKTVLEPLYGSQEKALLQIIEAKDRVCHVLYLEDAPAGILVFKTTPTNEFSCFKIEKSIEIKSLFLCYSGKNSGRGLGTELLRQLHQEVLQAMQSQDTDFSGYHVTVSEKVPESLNFFQKRGFVVMHTWNGKYMSDVKEMLLFCDKDALQDKLFLPSDFATPVKLRSETYILPDVRKDARRYSSNTPESPMTHPTSEDVTVEVAMTTTEDDDEKAGISSPRDDIAVNLFPN